MKLDKTKVVVFNGMPRSGKDTFGKKLEAWIDDDDTISLRDLNLDDWCNDSDAFGYLESFKDRLILLTLDYYQIDHPEWNERYENQKEEPWDKLNRLSQRQALIDMSENKIKPTLGKDFFGKCVAQEITDNNNVHILTDGGFPEELQPIIDKVGVENVLVIRLHRDGCTFEGDSRRLLKEDDFDGQVMMVDIKSDDITKTFERVLKEFLGWIKG